MHDKYAPYPLSATPPGVDVCIAEVKTPLAAERLERLGVWIGDYLNVSRLTRHGVLITATGHAPMLLPQHLARSIMVRQGNTSSTRQSP